MMAKSSSHSVIIRLTPILVIVMVMFSSWQLSAAPNYYYYPGLNYTELERLGEIKEDAKSEKIEAFLQKPVAGLTVTYRQLIDVLVAEGFHVYLRGGAVRDVLSLSMIEPNDVDLDYTGKVEDLIAICRKNHWQFIHFPNRKIVTIGDPLKGGIDAMPVLCDEKTDNEASLEFTINNIFYHCNNHSFLKSSEVGLQDLNGDRINILSENWKDWLYQPVIHPYYKIFRFWKMVGKGYVYTKQLQDFFIEETNKIIATDPKGWEKDINEHFSSHFYAYTEIYHGAVAIMGYDWAEEHLANHKKAFEKLYQEVLSEKKKYTCNP